MAGKRALVLVGGIVVGLLVCVVDLGLSYRHLGVEEFVLGTLLSIVWFPWNVSELLADRLSFSPARIWTLVDVWIWGDHLVPQGLLDVLFLHIDQIFLKK